MCYFNPTQCTKNGENIAIDYKYQPLWAQTLKLLYTLDWWKKKIALKNAEMVWNSWEHYLVMFASMLPWVPFPYHFQHCLEQFPFFFISPTCTKVLGFGPTQVSTYLFIFLKKSNVVMQIVTYSFVSSWINGENISIND